MIDNAVYYSKDFIDIMIDVYGLKRSGICLFGQKLLMVNSIFSGKKITNMPFNFYPSPRFTSVEEAKQFFIGLKRLCDNQRKYAEIKSTRKLLTEEQLTTLNVDVISPCLVSYLELSSSYVNYLTSLSKNHRQNIRTYKNKLKDGQIKISLANSLNEVDAFYNVLIKLYRDKHKMICHPFHIYKRLFESGIAQFRVAKINNQIVAGIVVIPSNEVYSYAWGAGSQKFDNLGLIYILIDWLIQDAIEKGIKYIDFGSSPFTDEGLLAFKSKWGCIHYPVYYYYVNRPHPKIVDYNESYRGIREIYHFMPFWLIKRLTPIIVPQLA